jgi:hypothetical protein
MGVNCGVALSRRSSWWPVAHRVSREKVVVPHVNHRHIITVFALPVIVSGCTNAHERESLRGTLDTRFAASIRCIGGPRGAESIPRRFDV